MQVVKHTGKLHLVQIICPAGMHGKNVTPPTWFCTEGRNANNTVI